MLFLYIHKCVLLNFTLLLDPHVVNVMYVYRCCTWVITSKMAYYFVQLIYFYSI